MILNSTSFTILIQSLSLGVSILEWTALSIVYPLLLGPCGTSGVLNVESNIRINATGNPEGIGRIVDDLVSRLRRYAILESLTKSLRLTPHSTRHTCLAGYFARTPDVAGSNLALRSKSTDGVVPMVSTFADIGDGSSFAAMGCP
jgi:hypothetical protein